MSNPKTRSEWWDSYLTKAREGILVTVRKQLHLHPELELTEDMFTKKVDNITELIKADKQNDPRNWGFIMQCMAFGILKEMEANPCPPQPDL